MVRPLGKSEDYENLGRFLGEATRLALNRYESTLIQLNSRYDSDELKKQKENILEKSKVLIHGAYECLESNAVQEVYNIILSFDNLLGRLENEVKIRIAIDRDDDESIDLLVNSNLEAIRRMFGKQGLEVSNKVFFSEEKEKPGIFIRYNPLMKMN